MKNTKKEGRIRFFFYPHKKYGWCGVCPTFGIVHYGEDLIKLKKDVFQMAVEYLQTVRDQDLPDKNLNRNVSPIHYLNLNFFKFNESVKDFVDFTPKGNITPPFASC